MASLINRLTKTKPSLRLVASLNASLAPKSASQIPNPVFVSSETTVFGGKVESSPRSSQIIFPSFPFGYCLNPRVPSSEPDVLGSEDSRTVWADSTKQKRKKKMNKHKVQKRRRLLRRKSGA